MFKASDYFGLLQQLEQFFTDSVSQTPLTQPVDPEYLQQHLSLDLPVEGTTMTDLKDAIASYLTYAVKTAHPAYFNQLWGGFSPTSFMGDMLTSATNTSMYTYEVAPAATLIETTLIEKMGTLVGFAQAEGQFTTGGSNGNLMAMAIARHHAFPSIKQTGMIHAPPLIAFVSEDAHYSFSKAAHLLGLGTEQVWTVPIDALGRMNVAELEILIHQARAQGTHPFFVAGTAGTTVRGAFDPLGEIAAVAQREKLWFHVDAAWGGSVLLSQTHRHLMQGVAQADSVVWDAHKMMGMSLMCSVLLVRQKGNMFQTFSSQHTDYIFHTEQKAPIDLGLSTMHCGRRVDAVKLWLSWKHLGDRGWETLIDHYFKLAAYAESYINTSNSLELLAPRQSLNLCFQYCPQNPCLSANQLTLKLRQALWEDGNALVNYAQIGDDIVLRLVICNNQTRLEDIDDFFQALIKRGQQMEKELG